MYDFIFIKKKERKIDREINTPLFILRCLQAGLTISDLEKLTFGMCMDIFTESNNDYVEYDQLATDEDIDNF